MMAKNKKKTSFVFNCSPKSVNRNNIKKCMQNNVYLNDECFFYLFRLPKCLLNAKNTLRETLSLN